MLRRGKELLLAGRLEAAVAALAEAISADPFSAEAHHQLARALRAQGEHFRAMTSFERAVELRADFFPALRSLAALYAEKGFRRKAVETLERAMTAAPDTVARDAVRANLLELLEACAGSCLEAPHPPVFPTDRLPGIRSPAPVRAPWHARCIRASRRACWRRLGAQAETVNSIPGRTRWQPNPR